MTDDRKILTLPSQIGSVRRYTDNGIGVTFRSTLEVSVQDMAVIDAFISAKTIGQLGFAANRLDLSDLPQDDAPSDTKSPSARLRAVMFLSWKQNSDQSEDFDTVYRRRIERMINHVKGELD